MLRISNLKFDINFDQNNLENKVAELLKINKPFMSFRIVKKALDTRSRQQAFFIYTVDVETSEEDELIQKQPWAFMEKIIPEEKLYVKPVPQPQIRPVIVGSGPAGMFAGLILAEAGCCPLILERGKSVPERQKDVYEFWEKRSLNPESNVQFGEGGAGTFSDGKLMTGIKKDRYTAKVFSELVEAGAPEEIFWQAKPHLGTDKLAEIVPRIRQKIISLGGEYKFEHRLDDVQFKDGKLQSITVQSPQKREDIKCENLVLALGHSARDTFEMLFKRNVPMVQKAFSVGVRIEHPQELINQAQYHNFAEHKALSAADYKLSVHLPSGRSAYTFCMCPGGVVVAAASESRRLVTNGMSYYARDGRNANSALLVGVSPEDFGGEHPLQGMWFQRNLEERAFIFGGENYCAPAQKFSDFNANRIGTLSGSVEPSYSCGTVPADLNKLFPDYISETIKSAVWEMDKKLHGFACGDAILTGVETRSSSPVRMVRDTSGQSPVEGIYPCGEGAGYAGGIVSSAADGIKSALNLLEKIKETI